jgi:hypothetical protein
MEPCRADWWSGMTKRNGQADLSAADLADFEAAVTDDITVVQSLEKVQPAKVEWLWYPWLPLGKLVILEGEPDSGKSTISVDFAAKVSRGDEFPPTLIPSTSEPIRPKQKGRPRAAAGVVLVGVEDDIEDTVVPRLDAARADRSRIFTMKVQRDDNDMPIPFMLPKDLNKLRDGIIQAQARLVVVDPITAYMSESTRSGDPTFIIRQNLTALAEVAAETRCCVLMIRHLNKSSGQNAKARGSGNTSYGAVVRKVMLAARNAEDPTGVSFVLASVKGNLTPAHSSLAYTLMSAPTNEDVAVCEWGESVDLTADQLVGADGHDSRRDAPAREQAEQMLRELLEDGPVEATEAMKVLKKNGLSESTIKRAKSALRVASEKKIAEDGKLGGWMWVLPQKWGPAE